MKTLYISKGQALNYDTLEAEHLVVNGVLNVAHGRIARTSQQLEDADNTLQLYIPGGIRLSGRRVLLHLPLPCTACGWLPSGSRRQRGLPRSAPPCPAISAPTTWRRTG